WVPFAGGLKEERPGPHLTSPREGSRHRSRDGCLRVRDRPRKRRAPPGRLPRVVAHGEQRARRGPPAHDLHGCPRADRRAPAGCRRARGVVRRRRRPHRALCRSGARRRARRRVVRRGGVRRVRAGARQAVRLRLRARRQGPGAADGEGDPRPARAAAAAPCGRRARGRDLPRARPGAAPGGCRAVIARLRGTVAARTAAGVVLDVGGVGYLVAATPRVAARVGEEATVETYLHVREDALQLYGFASADERALFELLLGVSGVGPKVALAIVSGSTPAELRRAIARDDTARFEAIPGI